MRAYRAAWLASFRGSYQDCSRESLIRSLATGDPILVSDFHPLQRSTRMLSLLIRDIDFAQPPCLVLELLPECHPVPAVDILERQEFRLTDGRLLTEVYEDCLIELAAKNGFVAGAWVEAEPAERDLAAARQWAMRRQTHPHLTQILHFGDWHLAEPHLPSKLRDFAANPRILHQSPEPLWDRVRPQSDEACLRLTGGHFAWLHTPPLAHWTSAAQFEDRSFATEALEASGDLVEEIAHHLADLIGNKNLPDSPFIFGPDEWLDFHHNLPAYRRKAFHPDFPPARFMAHPSENLFWVPHHLSWNHLVEMAASTLLKPNPLGIGIEAAAAQTSFCKLIPLAWNPFLAADSTHQIRQAYGQTPDQACQVARREEFLAEQFLGTQCAQAMLKFPLLGVESLRELLESGSHSFIWYLAQGTIRASSVIAS